MIIIRNQNIILNFETCKNMTFANFRCATNYFTFYVVDEKKTISQIQKYCVKDIKINCVNDKIKCENRKFSIFRVSINHFLFEIQISIFISKTFWNVFVRISTLFWHNVKKWSQFWSFRTSFVLSKCNRNFFAYENWLKH